jgi:hypothetical protein
VALAGIEVGQEADDVRLIDRDQLLAAGACLKPSAELEQVATVLVQRLGLAVADRDELIDQLEVAGQRNGCHPAEGGFHGYLHRP